MSEFTKYFLIFCTTFVVLSSNEGCVQTADKLVDRIFPLKVEEKPRLIIPNLFTPPPLILPPVEPPVTSPSNFAER